MLLKWTASFVFVIVCSASDFLTPFMFHPSMYCNAQLKKSRREGASASGCVLFDWRVREWERERERERSVHCVCACVRERERERERESKTTRETFFAPVGLLSTFTPQFLILSDFLSILQKIFPSLCCQASLVPRLRRLSAAGRGVGSRQGCCCTLRREL